jgi:hypothetical protein
MGNFKTWLNGLIGGFIGAVAAAVPVVIVDPLKFSPTVAGGLKNLGAVVLWAGLVGAALFLKQSPTPWDGVDRRNGGVASPQGPAQQGMGTKAVDNAQPK